MFGIDFSELVVIGVVALVVIGPERLPRVARTAGLLLGRMQRYVNSVKADISREMQLDELKKLQADIQESARNFERDITKEIKAVEQEVGQAAESLKTEVGQVSESVRAELTHSAQPVAEMQDEVKQIAESLKTEVGQVSESVKAELAQSVQPVAAIADAAKDAEHAAIAKPADGATVADDRVGEAALPSLPKG